VTHRFSRRDALLAGAGLALLARRALADDCSPDRLEQALRDIAKARATVTSITGPFTQERTIGLLAAKVKSTGTLTLVRPDRLRWELAPPDEAVYWIVPEGLAYQSKAGRGRVEAGGDKIAAALDDLRVLLAGDLTKLRARYDLTGTESGDDPIVFSAVPKAGQIPAARKIVFSLAPDLVSPKSVVLLEGPRDKTEIMFGAMQKNVAVDPARMRPPG
jgi:Outer membrane lipoprotein carrier protein LolA